ncbi:Spy/CpxP family protein refolding chaperone [Mesorhizobium dulcispinae]|uniref:Spy/CpxP family protein refolding chaperone n=1 Tax=Mesorhizobium dulcispinae TaxID=3072316 RepID=UPI002A240F4F|nr:Spy/CpxP family protein refolding chaperone [Mesorhizobium sp. VK23D]MDX8519871.1 Spy/CpxP family protein refolding chaperone [Mesorhizobium sp. VK23D]
MKNLFSTLAIGTLLALSAPVLANEAHHTTGGGNGSPPAAATEKAEDAGSATPMMMGRSMSNNMMSNGMMKMMMMDMMSGDDSPMGQMMSPEHIEGRIAFLSTELKLTKAQRPLWDGVAEALRANAGSAKDVMAKMPAGMMSGDSATGTPVKRIELQERMLSTRLEGLRRLKAALEPFYASLDDAQKAVADKLLMPAPMGMM